MSGGDLPSIEGPRIHVAQRLVVNGRMKGRGLQVWAQGPIAKTFACDCSMDALNPVTPIGKHCYVWPYGSVL